MLPVVVAPLDWADLNVALYLRGLKRVEAGDLRPLPPANAAAQTLRLRKLHRASQPPVPAAPQPSESASDLVSRGKALVAQMQYAEAIPILELAAQLEPGNCDVWRTPGVACGELGRWDGALTADECALASTSDDASIWQNKGKALCYLGRDEEALTAYERALALDPRHALAWAYMGHVLRTMRRSKEALDTYDRAISIQPTAWFWYGKAKALRALGREAEAQKAAKRAKELGW